MNLFAGRNVKKEPEPDVLLYLKNAINSTGNNELLFFETAYYWRFKKHQDVVNDVVQYRLHAIIPSYVVEYVRHLQSITT